MKRIGDYQLLELLGSGNHGDLYLARPPARLSIGDDVVAVKVLADAATDADFARMAVELRAFNSVRSDHLVTLFDAGQQGGRLFYASRYYPDGSLATVRPPGQQLPQGVITQAIVDTARAAHALHEVGIVHRDIKPANVLLAQGRGFLADLALAQVDTPGMTTTGIGPIGSIEYMEPDVVYGERAARASDIWSLAATLHRALTGRGIFGEIPQRSALEAFRHVLGTTPSIDESIDGELRRVLVRALAERRADRYPTAGDFAADLAVAEGCS